MRKLFIIVIPTITLFVVAGCAQSIVYREFYEPNEQTMTVRDDGTRHGAVKTEGSKAGSPDWSDQKSFSVQFLGIGK